MLITNSRPEGYNHQTKCCIRCKYCSDHSHLDSLELYCNHDRNEPSYPDYKILEIGSTEWDSTMSVWYNWSVSRIVEAWSVCPKWEPLEPNALCQHGRKLDEYCSDCYTLNMDSEN